MNASTTANTTTTKKIRVPLEEQETTVGWFPKQVDEFADFYSANPTEIRRFKKFCETDPEDVILEKEDEYGIFGKIRTSWITYRRPRRNSMTPEQRALAAERARLNFGKTNPSVQNTDN